ncbi:MULTISPECIES: hypothetical protein [Streptomyces]|uniref:hypothetical protein n=1 Tax=Streptomyces TaxID=1883 RepID=UPI00131D0083|nr:MULTISPECIES: hypothetical protein [Streptomyces]
MRREGDSDGLLNRRGDGLLNRCGDGLLNRCGDGLPSGAVARPRALVECRA